MLPLGGKLATHWIGLSLLARLSLILMVAMNAIGSDSVNVLVITSVTAGILAIRGRVYEKHYNDLLESSLILRPSTLRKTIFNIKLLFQVHLLGFRL